jgi:hypothetical protein
MAFKVKNWVTLSSSGNASVITLDDGTYIGGPTMWGYISGEDTIADMLVADYFVDQAPTLSVTDLIYCAGTDGEQFLTVAGVNEETPTVITTSVTPASGDVDGPASSTDNALVRFSGTTGKIIQNSGIIADDSDNVTGMNNLDLDGTLDVTGLGTFDAGLGVTGTATVTGTQDIIHTATENDDHAFEIDCDAAGFSDVKAVDIAYVTGAIAATEEEAVILVNIHESASTGGSVSGLEVLTTAEGSATIYGMETFVNVNPILQSSGTFGNMDSALNIAVDVLAALSSGGAGNISGFVADNDTMTIGDAAKFEEMEWILGTGASGAGIAPTFEYSNGAGPTTFTSFGPIDGTNGMRNSGAIAWLVGDLPGWVVGDSGEFEIRITRTRNTLTTTPIIDEVQIAATTEYKWDKAGDLNVKSVTVAADPTANLELATKQYVDNNAGTSSTVKYNITQASHTLVVGNWVYNNAGTYTVGANTSVAASEIVGVVVDADPDGDGNAFTLQTNGLAAGLSGLTDSTVYFLGTAGALTATEPSAEGEVVKPLLVASGTTSGVMINFRGELIGAATTEAYDMPFNAGFSSAGVKEDVAVQSYGFMVAGRTGSFTSETGYAETAPTDADLILDITKNGTSIYSTLPEFAATSQTLTAGVLKTDGTEDFVKGDRIVFKITQIGSTEPGEGIQFTCVAEAT